MTDNQTTLHFMYPFGATRVHQPRPTIGFYGDHSKSLRRGLNLW